MRVTNEYLVGLLTIYLRMLFGKQWGSKDMVNDKAEASATEYIMLGSIGVLHQHSYSCFERMDRARDARILRDYHLWMMGRE